jgi:uncharacterized membrane protein YhhN
MSPFPFLALAAMTLDWIARWRANRPLEYISKPLTIVFLLAWLVQRSHLAGGAAWFAIALGLSLVGDILLMLPSERFIGGLAAFFVAQIAYIVAFNGTPLGRGGVPWIAALLVVGVGMWVYSRLAAGLVANATPRLRLPLLIYSSALAGMLFSALACLARPAWSLTAAAPAALGAALFFVSDTLHGWNKFVGPLWGGRLLVHITYHLGQFGITLGAILHLSIHLVA